MKSEIMFDVDIDDVENSGVPPEESAKNASKTSYAILKPMNVKPLKLPQSQIDIMLESYNEICVQDFGDMYHMPEDERRTVFEFYDAFKEVRRLKIRYRDVDKFIYAYRAMLKCLNTVAEKNGVYETEKFIKKVLTGKIVVSGLKIPKFIGKERKNANWEMITEYIMNPELDPRDLKRDENLSYWKVPGDDDIENFKKEVGCSIEEYSDSIDKETYVDGETFNPEVDDPMGKNIIVPLPIKDQKKLSKKKDIMMGISEAKKNRKSSGKFKGWAYELSTDAFDQVADIDFGRKSIMVPQFKGDALKSKDVEEYLWQLEQFEREHTVIEYRDRTYSVDQFESMELKDYLESEGVDIRKCILYTQDTRKEKKKIKSDKKKIKRMKKRLQNIEQRVKDRKKSNGVNTKKKGNKKKHKKDKEKVSEIHPDNYHSFDDYAKDMERM